MRQTRRSWKFTGERSSGPLSCELPEHAADKEKLEVHRREVQRRADYLSHLDAFCRSPIPAEQHVQPVTLNMEVPPIRINRSPCAVAIGSQDGWKTFAACAAIGAAGGLMVLGGAAALSAAGIAGSIT